MADMMDTLKGLLGDGADEKLNNIMQIINSDNQNPPPSPEPQPELTPPLTDLGDTISPEMLMAAQSIIGSMSQKGDDERTKLLKSLKPFMRKERQDTIDSAVKMLNLAHLSQFFKGVI